MDGRAARVLQVRVALGGKVGARVTLISTEVAALVEKIGAAGEVTSLNDDGTINVRWDGGGQSSIDVLRSELELHTGTFRA